MSSVTTTPIVALRLLPLFHAGKILNYASQSRLKSSFHNSDSDVAELWMLLTLSCFLLEVCSSFCIVDLLLEVAVVSRLTKKGKRGDVPSKFNPTWLWYI
jgi:hypothetical protein